MKRLHTAAALQAALVAALACATPALAQKRTSQPRVEDAHAPVYIVSSRATFEHGLQSIAQESSARRDALGRDLVLTRLRAHQVGDLARHVHEKENRCGGFFAFDTKAQAEAFIRGDRSAQALRKASLLAYPIDNGATVNPWLTAVDSTRIKSTISTLSAYTNRYYSAPTGKTSAEWIRSTWDGLASGRSDVSSELFNCSNCSTQPSVILTIQGAELPNEIVVLGAHLDSINGSGGGSPTQVAPGADDDASGIATLTEVLRVAMANGWRPKRTVKFMGYAAEEVGLRGSNAIAQSFASAGSNVVGVLQLDMTNYQTGATEMRIVSDYSNADMKQFLADLFDTYLAPLGIQRGTYTCGYGCSDHASWTSAGYPAAIMFEGGTSSGGYNPNIHTTADTLANMGDTAAPSAHFAKLGLAFLGELGKTAGTGGNAPPVANFSNTVSGLTVNFTDTSTDSDGTIASRSWEFGDGTTSTAANPSKTYSAGGTYAVKLTVTDDDGASSSKTQNVTVGTTGTVLQRAVPVSNLSAAAGASLNYTMVVPAGSQNLTFTTSGGSGDADLYVKFGSAPTDSVYDCRPYKSGNAETCTFATPQAGTYYVRVKAYSAFSGLTLVGDYIQCGDCGPGPIPYTNNTDYTISDNATVDSPITVSGRTGNAPSNATVAVNIVHTYIGDLKVDLVAPDGTLYNIHNRSGGSADNINKTVTLNLSSEAISGTWKLRVNDNATNDVGYINSWTITL